MLRLGLPLALLGLAVYAAPALDSASTSAGQSTLTFPCKDSCSTWCTSACHASGVVTPICLDDRHCKCICPVVATACTSEWCSNFCLERSKGREHVASCTVDKKLCHCEYPAVKTTVETPKQLTSETPTPVETSNDAPSEEKTVSAASKSSRGQQSFLSDPTLKSTGWLCEQKWCLSYCTSKLSPGATELEAHCDSSNSCICEWQMPPVSTAQPRRLTASRRTGPAPPPAHTSAATTPQTPANDAPPAASPPSHHGSPPAAIPPSVPSATAPAPTAAQPQTTKSRAACQASWCDGYCAAHVTSAIENGAKANYTASCDHETETCNCKFTGVPSSTLSNDASATSGEKAAAKSGPLQMVAKKCTDEWCNSFCLGKAAGREWQAHCELDQTCKCVFPWKKTSTRTVSSATPLKSEAQ